MASSPGTDFRVIWSEAVQAQVSLLLDRATALDLREAFVATVREANRRLRVAPLEWGDPECHLRKMALLKCHAVLAPLIVYFAVDEARSLVYVLEVRPLPNHPLAADR